MEANFNLHLTFEQIAHMVRQLPKTEQLQLVKVLQKEDKEPEENIDTPKIKLSDKYRGILTKEEGGNLNLHIQQMRNEWNSI